MTNQKIPRKGQKKVKNNEIEAALEENYNSFDFNFKKRLFKFTEKQQQLIEILKKDDVKIVLVEGPAGVSKTLLGVYCGLLMMKEKKIDSIMYLRSVVESAQRSMGFLKGDESQKMAFFSAIVEDKLSELLNPQDMTALISFEKIVTMPLNYVRGCSWRRKFILVDEGQNFSINELLSTLTRIGEGSVMFVAADRTQSDISNSGFGGVFDLFDNEESRDKGVYTFQFTEEDIVRSEIVKFVVKKFKQLK